MLPYDLYQPLQVQSAVEPNPKLIAGGVRDMFNFLDAVDEPKFKHPSLKVAYHRRSPSISARLHNLALKIERSDVRNSDFVVNMMYMPHTGGKVRSTPSLPVLLLPYTAKHAAHSP